MNGQNAISPVEANSSPSHIIATKGSSVWMHCNYTYVGDGRHGIVTVIYKEQIIGFNTTLQPTIQTLARRTGQNGALTLESPVPAPFNGRVDAISANSTFVIHGLQFNHSTYQFSSSVNVYLHPGLGAVAKPNIYNLKPIVSITVNGMSICSSTASEDFTIYSYSSITMIAILKKGIMLVDMLSHANEPICYMYPISEGYCPLLFTKAAY